VGYSVVADIMGLSSFI